LIRLEVCALSGLLPTEYCEHTRMEWFITGTEPSDPDNVYKQVTIDTLTGALADDSTPPSHQGTRIVLDLPITALPWARSQGLPLLADIPGADENTTQPQIILVSPREGTAYRVDPAFDPSAQKILIEVVAGVGLEEITIWVDGVPLATLTDSPYQGWWQLIPGEHRFWATGKLANGETVTSQVVVINVGQ
jgi:hypothetical protein